jgi:hypothetical protein
VSTLGIDTSAVDGNKPMDFHAIKAAGARFVILKRSQYLRPDVCYARDSADARKAGLVVGSYFFPSVALNAASPKQQVAAFKSAPGDVVRDKDLPPALDIEGGGGGWAHYGRPKSEIVELLRQCVLELQAAYRCRPLVYTSYNQWYDLGLPAAPWASKCPLWIKTAYRLKEGSPVDQVAPKSPHADYDALHDPHNHERIPPPWHDAGFWVHQWQGDATGFPGAGKTVDMDHFHTARKGDSDARIKMLHRKLGLKEAPVFDDALDHAVRGFQSSHGLAADGVVGPATFAGIAWHSD